MKSTSAHSQCSKPQAKLCKEKALEIFKLLDISPASGKPNASFVAREYGVNEKTIRDIWTGRTWNEETQPLAINREPKKREKAGRPLGCKDSVPRRRKGSPATSELTPKSMKQHASSEVSANSSVRSDARVDTWAKVACTPEVKFGAYNSTPAYIEGACSPPDSKRRRLLSELTTQPLSSLEMPSAEPFSSQIFRPHTLTSEQLDCVLSPQARFAPSVPPPLMLPTALALSLRSGASAGAEPPSLHPRLVPRADSHHPSGQSAAYPPPPTSALWPPAGASPLLSELAAGRLPLTWAGVPPTALAGPYAAADCGPPAGLLLAATLRRLDRAPTYAAATGPAAAPTPPGSIPACFWQLAAAQAWPGPGRSCLAAWSLGGA